jgi:hypothetical protein
MVMPNQARAANPSRTPIPADLGGITGLNPMVLMAAMLEAKANGCACRPCVTLRRTGDMIQSTFLGIAESTPQ